MLHFSTDSFPLQPYLCRNLSCSVLVYMIVSSTLSRMQLPESRDGFPERIPRRHSGKAL